MQALFYVYAVLSQPEDKGESHQYFNASIMTTLIFAILISSMLRIFENQIFDIGGVLADCCSFGPLNPKNPFSSKAIAFTYVALPLALIANYIFQMFAKRHVVELEMQYKFSKWLPCLFVFALVMVTPIGAQGNGAVPWVVLAVQGLMYALFSVWVRFQKKPR